jgi:hypothetical protein
LSFDLGTYAPVFDCCLLAVGDDIFRKLVLPVAVFSASSEVSASSVQLLLPLEMESLSPNFPEETYK